MAKLVWDQDTERLYETGVEKCALYVMKDDGTYDKGVAWNGIVSIQESPSGADSNPIYANDKKYLDIRSSEEFGATIQAYTYPKEFEACDGSAALIDGVDYVTIGQQARRAFGLAYKTLVGNDVKNNDFSYKLHIVYGCTASPSEREYQTVNDSPEAITFSWELTTNKVEIENFRPTALVTIDVSKIASTDTVSLNKVKALEEKLYGTNSSEPQLATISDLNTIFGGATGATGSTGAVG